MAAFTVKAQQGGSTASGTALRVKVLTGAALASSQPGGTPVSQHATAAQNLSITTTVTGSQVYGALWTATTGTFTAEANTTFFDNVHETDGLIHGTCRSTSATGTPGATVFGASAPSTSGSIVLAEILANGTIAEDASGPAFVYGNTTSATSAAFSPPAPSMLLVLVSANGGAGVTTMTISDTSGLGLTWTALVQVNPSGGAYAGIWAAQIPSPPSSTGSAPAPALVIPVLTAIGVA